MRGVNANYFSIVNISLIIGVVIVFIVVIIIVVAVVAKPLITG
jgi:hypothetical protein